MRIIIPDNVREACRYNIGNSFLANIDRVRLGARIVSIDEIAKRLHVCGTTAYNMLCRLERCQFTRREPRKRGRGHEWFICDEHIVREREFEVSK